MVYAKLCLISVRTWLIVYYTKTGKPSQKILLDKRLFKNVTLQILDFIPVSYLIKIFPI